MSSKHEVWRPVLGFEGFYSVSRTGLVRRDAPSRRSQGGYHLKLSETRDGYLCVGLSRPDRRPTCGRVHRLVYEAHVGPIAKGLVVNHKNGVKTDNRVENLEAITSGENVRHAFRVLGRDARVTKLSRTEAEEIRHLAADGETLTSVAHEFGVSCTMVSAIVHGEVWRNAGGPTRERTRRKASLTDDEALELIRRFNAGENRTELAREFGTNKRTVYNLAQGRTRAYLLERL